MHVARESHVFPILPGLSIWRPIHSSPDVDMSIVQAFAHDVFFTIFFVTMVFFELEAYDHHTCPIVCPQNPA